MIESAAIQLIGLFHIRYCTVTTRSARLAEVDKNIDDTKMSRKTAIRNVQNILKFV